MSTQTGGATPSTSTAGATPDADSSTATDTPEAGATPAPEDYDTWIKGQPPEVKTRIDSRLSALQSALKSERDGKNSLERQLKTLSKSAKDSPELQAQIDKLSADLETEALRGSFLEESFRKGVSDPVLAWKAVQGSDFVDKRGQVDWSRLQEEHPALFAKPEAPKLPSANAAAGTGKQPAQTTGPNSSINRALRRAAGHRT